MKLEEIKKLIVKAASMENAELVCFFQSESRYAHMFFNSIVDTKDERKASTIRMMVDAEIRSLIYQNELEDRLEKGKKSQEYSIELEYKNDDLKAEIEKLNQKIEDLEEELNN